MLLRLLFLAIFLFSLQPAFARDIYRITNVSVFIEADDSNLARNVAILDGEKKAYEELVKRFLDYGYMEKQPKLSDTQIDQIISRMQVKDEKITDNTYSAKLDFWFNPIKTANFFKIEHKSGNPTRARYIVIPAYLEDGELKIWEHEWFNAWANYRKSNLILPLGDLDDISILKTAEISQGDYKSVDALARKYKSPTIIIAKAKYITEENKLVVLVERLEGKNIDFYEITYPGGFGVGAFELYATASSDLVYRIQNNELEGQEPEEDPEKPDYFRNYDFERVHKFKDITARVLAKDLVEWSRIRRKILKSEYIEEMAVKSFKSNEIMVHIKFNGMLDQLDSEMQKYGLILNPEGKNKWTIEESMKAVIETDVLSEQEIKRLEKEEKERLSRDHRYTKDEKDE